jgi:putative DNA primase/helicase
MSDETWEDAAANAPAPETIVIGEGEELERNRNSDRANAIEFARHFDGRIVWVPEIGWLFYDGKRWIEDTGTQRLALVGELVDELWLRSRNQSDEQRTITRARVKRLEGSDGAGSMLFWAGSLMTKSILEFDTSPFLFNLPNGTLNFERVDENGLPVLQLHSPTDYITRICNVPWDPEAYDEVWEKVIDHAFAKEKRQVFQRFLGYSMTGDTRLKIIMVLYGPTDGGKSTIASACSAVLGNIDTGGYSTTWDAEVIQAGSRVNRLEKLHKARAARLITVGELEKGSRMADNFVKMYSGGEPVDARALFKSSYTYRPGGKLLMSTNYVPRSADTAVSNRLLLMAVTTVEKKDPSVKTHLDTDLNAHKAILVFAARGAVDWLREDTLGPTPWLESEIVKYARDSDPIMDFVKSVCTEGAEPSESIRPDTIFLAYTAWANEYVARPLKRRAFESALEERGYQRGRFPAKGGPVMWLGLGLLPQEELPTSVAMILGLHRSM